MSKHAITEAAGITADEVLRIGKLYSPMSYAASRKS
ncbi:hypothetical protein GLGCALEP_00834 [Pseudomonas sp. MM221]|nr:hypothetical protein DBADOPDK_00813 [Pseudomonas sp. MM223]CAI3793979.1 hypothetical protein GLGCALEP_00834 [Pseudomonas sp. MM221]